MIIEKLTDIDLSHIEGRMLVSCLMLLAAGVDSVSNINKILTIVSFLTLNDSTLQSIMTIIDVGKDNGLDDESINNQILQLLSVNTEGFGA